MSNGDVIKDFLDDAGARMTKSVESNRNELATVRTGRASPHLLDRIEVDYYGARTPLNQLSQVSATEARLLTITPYDKSSIKQIEKAILESDVGLTPNNDGNVIRLQIPELTEERRKELVKVVHGVAEEGRVAIRNLRRTAKQALAILVYSLRRSSVSSGKTQRSTLPSLAGLTPRSESRMARSTSFIAPMSKGWTKMIRGSGEVKDANCCSGVGRPIRRSLSRASRMRR
jgi:ribosome recycling factor